MSRLAERLLVVHAALDEAKIPHAFGGAIALAYCVLEPRGTRDIDVNVFVGPERAAEVLDALPDGIIVRPVDRATIQRDGQVRLWWDEMPVDLFFDTHDYHRTVGRAVVEVPFEGTTIAVLDCTALIVFKAIFGRGRDWGDIETIIDDGGLDYAQKALGELRKLMGSSDGKVLRLAGLVQRGSAP
jgi:hypothetical protein